MDVKKGQRVKFKSTHDQSHEHTGTIVRVHEDSELVDIAVEPDGKIFEVASVATAHRKDCTAVTEEPHAEAHAQRGEKGERGPRGLRGRQGEPGED
jgi:hypothetical protein